MTGNQLTKNVTMAVVKTMISDDVFSVVPLLVFR